MRHLSARSRHPDTVSASWLTSLSFLLASFGGSIVQMWLLAIGWQITHSAEFPAALFASWIAGTWLASRRYLFGPGIAGMLALASLLVSADPSFARVPLHLPFSAAIRERLLFLLLMASTGAWFQRWLGKERPGSPGISEHMRNARQWSALTVGLALVWWQPTAHWSMQLVALLCLPLLVLDLCRWSPLAVASRVLLRRMRLDEQRPASLQLDLDLSDLPPGWIWTWLRMRGILTLTLLAAGVNIVLVVVWGSIATPFAAAVGPTSPLLVFLALSQFAALLVGRLLTETGLRGWIGKPFRPLPFTQRQVGRRLLLLVLLGLACSLLLIGLGLPLSWPFVLVFGAYTLCGAFWSLLLPRVQLTREMMARETPLASSVWQVPSEWPDQQATLAVEQAMERAVAGRLEQISMPFLLPGLPLCGWLIDKGGIHRLFLLSGFLLLLFVISGLLVGRREHHVLLLQSQGATSRDSPRRTVRFDEQDAYER
jgi:hypothetical protein